MHGLHGAPGGQHLRPGRLARAEFTLEDLRDQLRQLRDAAASGRAVRPEYVVEVLDEAGEVVARARKTLYVRLKPARRPPAAAEISAPDHSL